MSELLLQSGGVSIACQDAELLRAVGLTGAADNPYIPGRANSADHPTYTSIRNPLAELPDDMAADDEPLERARR